MDYESTNINRRDEILARFRESLALPMSQRFYDEDELIEIFDFAGDVGDDYLRMEVLMCAARFYSDSEELNERKAIFYSQYSDDVGDKFIDDNNEADGLMWDIMRGHRAAPQTDEAKREILDRLVDDYDDFKDEEVIQFIDLVSSYGQIDWLRENIDKLRKKVEFINILLYEAAIVADSLQDAHLSVKLLEELTELEPFNFYFWTMLAKEYAVIDETEKSLNAIDYALAINPTDMMSMLVKAKLLYTSGRDIDEATEILKQVVASATAPDSIEAVRLLSNIYSEQDKDILALTVLEDFIKAHPDDATELIPDMIVYRPKNIDELLDRFYKDHDENSQFVWTSWAFQLSQSGYSDVADAVIDAYKRNSGEKLCPLFQIENAFKACRFNDAIVLTGEYIESQQTVEAEFPSLMAMHILSMIKCGEIENVLALCDMLLEKHDLNRFSTLATRLEMAGLLQMVKDIKENYKYNDDPLDWMDYDPLELWN